MNLEERAAKQPRQKLPDRLPKLCGADIELGNFIVGRPDQRDTCSEAARLLLREIDGQPSRNDTWSWSSRSASASSNDSDTWDDAASYPSSYGERNPNQDRSGYDPQDWGRRFLHSNGGCAYIDLGHLELCIPEVRSAFDHVACTHAMLRIAHRAQIAASRRLPSGQRIHVLANNSDGRGNSYGSHLNFLITQRAYETIFHRKMHYLLYLAAYQVSSIVLSGQGKVGAENGRPWVPYQLSARADFFETLVGEQTTYRRPIVNARDEALCGSVSQGCPRETDGMARLHVIFYDHALCHVAKLLTVGVMQILLAMIECEQVDSALILDDPLAAVVAWSHDPTLRTRARMASRRMLTAVELQLRFFELAAPFVERGACDGFVSGARQILSLWGDTLVKLKNAASSTDPAAFLPLAPRLDWVLKLNILRQALNRRPDLTWDAEEIAHLDRLYSSIDPNEGLYWAYERSGFVEKVVSERWIQHFEHEPPEDTRAWTRTMLLRRFPPDVVSRVDWDQVELRLRGEDYWPTYRTVCLNNPLAFTRAAAASAPHDANGLSFPSSQAEPTAEPEDDRPNGSRVQTAPRYPLVRVRTAGGEPETSDSGQTESQANSQHQE